MHTHTHTLRISLFILQRASNIKRLTRNRSSVCSFKSATAFQQKALINVTCCRIVAWLALLMSHWWLHNTKHELNGHNVYLQFTIQCLKKLILRSVIQKVQWSLWKKTLMQGQTFPGEPCTVVNLDPKHVVGEIASSICICCSTILLDKFMVFTCQNKGWTTAGILSVCQLLFAFYHKDPIWQGHWKIFEITASWHFNHKSYQSYPCYQQNTLHSTNNSLPTCRFPSCINLKGFQPHAPFPAFLGVLGSTREKHMFQKMCQAR